MVNQCILVGRLEDWSESERRLSMRVRKYPNKNQDTETVVIPCTLMTTAEGFFEHLEKDITIGIKGRLTIEEGEMRLLGEKITFITKKKEEKTA